ncbi:membrane or secreted protein [Rufibacter sp. XAAS-G3-1]|uniref:membrane or secreted protein n=1 Tax=Rufibacter sp. XAAS-G3-1 TaxID=2729134 RepID=UPI0015E63096|nr:membrane or secreted protein [Rufibacter sp. XAAS-G3-1]
MATLSIFSFKALLGIGLLFWGSFSIFSPETTITQNHQLTSVQANPKAAELEGAWQLVSKARQEGQASVVQTLADGFFSVAHFDKAGKRFMGTYGGTYTLTNGKLTAKYEFNTFDSTRVGSAVTGTLIRKNGKWQLQTVSGVNNAPQTWEKVPEKNPASPLAGAWRISGREGQNGQMNQMVPGPRKTIKILSGDRFQWIAFNSETAAFSGTGGGTYTAQNGKYTEHIEFFSRDNNRVGMQLTFNYEVKDGNWHHTGLSSTGGKVNEIWTRRSINQ